VIFRRVMMVVLPLLAVVFLVMLLQRLYLSYESDRLQEKPLPKPDLSGPRGVEEMPVAGGAGHIVSQDVDFVRQDAQHRNISRFTADLVIHYTKDTADITRPCIEYYTKPKKENERGAVITIVADKGKIVTRGSMLSLDDIESGVLYGHVVLTHDNGTPDDDSDDLLVGVEDLRFDNGTYAIWTDGPVVMIGPQMDLTARKMRMVLDRDSRRITSLTFLEEIFITFLSEKRLKMGLTPEPGEAPPEPETTAETATAADTTSPAAGAGGGSGPSSPTPDAAAAPVASATAPATPLAKRSADLWRIDLAGNVDARQDLQRIRCDHLKLYNEASGSLVESGPTDRVRRETVSDVPKPPVSAGAAESDGRGGAAANSSGRSAAANTSTRRTSAASTKAAEAPSPAAGMPGPLFVMATGPLMLSPVDEAERAAIGEECNEITAEGRPVTVEDGRMTAVGGMVRYNLAHGTGVVDGRDGVVHLDQPDRMHLVGKRLEFDRSKATADVLGEGELHARVSTDGLTGVASSSGAKSAKEPSTLDARWTRGMNLKFYRLPASDAKNSAAGGEIQQAAFHGQAEVKQRDGILRGDELTIDFFPAVADRGQAVQRLVGHGDVYVKNDRPGAAADTDTVGGMSVGDIACQDLDMAFTRTATGDTDPERLKASGKVAINDPKGKVRAEDLTVTFGRTASGKLEAQFLEAFGDVLIDRADLYAQGRHIRRDLANGVLILEGTPATAKRGTSRIVGPYIAFRQQEGVAVVRGEGELEAPATTDLRGQPRQKAEPLIVKWKNGMRFEDARNFAQFDGDVTAETGGSRLAARKMWVYFADRSEALPKTASADKAAAKSTDATTGSLDNLFGRKAFERLYAEKDVRTLDSQLAADGTVRHQMEMVGDNLTYLAANQKAYMRGPGRLRLLSREKPNRGETEPSGLAPADVAGVWKGPVPPGYARTDIGWTDSMAYEGSAKRAFFKGDVDARHVGRGVPGEQGKSRAPTDSRILSADLRVVFSENKKPSRGEDVEDSMTVDKMIADGGVRLWVDDRLGSGQRLTYYRDPQTIHLFRGPDAYAQLWQENEAKQKYAQIEAGEITFHPSSGRVDVKDQQGITIGR